jgi:hypothetical protein
VRSVRLGTVIGQRWAPNLWLVLRDWSGWRPAPCSPGTTLISSEMSPGRYSQETGAILQGRDPSKLAQLEPGHHGHSIVRVGPGVGVHYQKASHFTFGRLSCLEKVLWGSVVLVVVVVITGKQKKHHTIEHRLGLSLSSTPLPFPQPSANQRCLQPIDQNPNPLARCGLSMSGSTLSRGLRGAIDARR